MEDLAKKYAHIKGWGVDADPRNEPTYPMKHWTGDDHNRLNYERAEQQPVDQEILKSTERPEISRVFGTAAPLSGLSGLVRKLAFQYSENQLRHWLVLVMADRINVVEGLLEDLAHGHIPNTWKERGWNSELKHNPQVLTRRILVRALILGAAGALIYTQVKKGSRRRTED